MMLSGADLGRAAKGPGKTGPVPNARPASKLPSVDRLRKVWSYNANTGELRNRYTRSHNAEAGEIAGSVNKANKRRYVWLDGDRFLTSRVAWAIYYGEWPNGVLDHKDNDSLNDKIKNLRDTTQTINMRNTGIPKSNTSGHKGVAWHKRDKKWRAFIDQTRLGTFDTVEAAINAREGAEAAMWGECR